MPNARVAAVIPCYREREHILEVLHAVPQLVEHIICVDDGCPEGTGAYVESGCEDPRVRVVYHAENRGVGAAMVTGYRAALDTGAELIVKLDGDGQTDPALIPRFVAPIRVGLADYTKGNRFKDLKALSQMPAVRLFGSSMAIFAANAAPASPAPPLSAATPAGTPPASLLSFMMPRPRRKPSHHL